MRSPGRSSTTTLWSSPPAVARRSAGQDIGDVLGIGAVGLRIVASVGEALRSPCDVLVDYTSHAAVRSHIDRAISRGVARVVGSSGLTGADYAEIDAAARERGIGVVAAGNFSMMAAILQHCALLAARHLEWFEGSTTRALRNPPCHTLSP